MRTKLSGFRASSFRRYRASGSHDTDTVLPPETFVKFLLCRVCTIHKHVIHTVPSDAFSIPIGRKNDLE